MRPPAPGCSEILFVSLASCVDAAAPMHQLSTQFLSTPSALRRLLIALLLCLYVVSLIGCGNSKTARAARVSAVSVMVSFDGAYGPGYKDHPDTAGAVGPNHVVDFVGSTFTVRDKTTGQVLEQMSQATFWTRAGLSPGALNDLALFTIP